MWPPGLEPPKVFSTMAKKPNYAFERNAKAKAKAEKREAKRVAKLATKTLDPAADTASDPEEDASPAEALADDRG
ncbi:MAG: hypothetical protein ACI9DC_002144 [Gammaproteobacteria bacterium]|jgi:hypothetical protein